MAQLTIGSCTTNCGNVCTGHYYGLNFDIFLKLITVTFSYIAHKTLQVATISFYNILWYAFLI